MSTQQEKKGYTVKQIEQFTCKFCYELCIIVLAIIATISASLFSYASLSLVFLTVGIIYPLVQKKTSSAFAEYVHTLAKSLEKTASILLGALFLLIGVIFPPVIFGIVGLISGKKLSSCSCCCTKDIEKDKTNTEAEIKETPKPKKAKTTTTKES